MNKAFTLVELSIVLVILGLLTGGILTGQSLIRAAELRSVVTEAERYLTSVHTFRDKYRSLPGDITNATSFWGKDNAACPTHTGTATTPGTCNGNGDGAIPFSSAAGGTGEAFQFWKHMALAGLIEGSYTGLAGAGSTQDAILGTNIPASKISNAGFTLFTLANYGGDGDTYAMDYGYLFIFGAKDGVQKTQLEVLRPEEAWNIDTKMDDGLPARGKIIARFWDDDCAAADDGTPANDDYAASYRVSDQSVRCALHFRKIF